MVHTDLDAAFKHVVETTAARLKPLGFKKSRATFRKLCDGNSGLIEFQRSLANTREKVSFTVNLAVVCGRLLDREYQSVERAGALHGHLRERIGTLLPAQTDTWWVIEAGTDVAALSLEVAGIIETIGAPYVERHIHTEDLIAAWKAGKSLGTGEFTRLRYLAELSGDE